MRHQHWLLRKGTGASHSQVLTKLNLELIFAGSVVRDKIFIHCSEASVIPKILVL